MTTTESLAQVTSKRFRMKKQQATSRTQASNRPINKRGQVDPSKIRKRNRDLVEDKCIYQKVKVVSIGFILRDLPWFPSSLRPACANLNQELPGRSAYRRSMINQLHWTPHGVLTRPTNDGLAPFSAAAPRLLPERNENCDACHSYETYSNFASHNLPTTGWCLPPLLLSASSFKKEMKSL